MIEVDYFALIFFQAPISESSGPSEPSNPPLLVVSHHESAKLKTHLIERAR